MPTPTTAQPGADAVPTADDLECIYDAYSHLMLEADKAVNPLVRDILSAAARPLGEHLTRLHALTGTTGAA